MWSGHSPWAQLQSTYHLPVLYTSFLLLNQFISIHINFLIFYFNSGLNHRPQLNWVQSHTNTTMYKWKIWILIYKLMVCIIGRNPICLFRVGNRSYEFKTPWLAYDLTIYDVSLLSVHESIMIYILGMSILLSLLSPISDFRLIEALVERWSSTWWFHWNWGSFSNPIAATYILS